MSFQPAGLFSEKHVSDMSCGGSHPSNHCSPQDIGPDGGGQEMPA